MEGEQEVQHKDDYNSSFRDTVWLSQWPLNAETVMYYFAASQFYDRTCNNERLKMQRLEAERLKTMRGIEYELLPTQLPEDNRAQNLFVIVKQRRETQTKVRPLAFYYVLDGTIYQAPNIQAILGCRLRTCAHHLRQALDSLSVGVRYTSSEGYSWDFSTEAQKMKPIAQEGLGLVLKRKAEEEKKLQESSARVQTILLDLLKKYVPEVIKATAADDSAQAAEVASTANTANDAERPSKMRKIG